MLQLLLVFVNKAAIRPLRHNDDDVTLGFSALDQRLINTVFSIELESKFRNKAHVDVTTCQARAHREVPALAARHTNNSDSEFSCLSFDVCRINEPNRLLSGSREAEALVDEGNVVVDGRRNSDDANLKVAFANHIL